MSSANNNQTTSDDSEEDFPVAAIVCIAVGGYILIVIAIIVIRYFLVNRGKCKGECSFHCRSGESSGCCARISEPCTCCCKGGVDGCLSKVCGKPKRTNCIDILLCNCCGCTEGCCDCCCRCPDTTGCCRICGDCFSCRTCCDCGDCCHDDLAPGTCGCLCLEVKFRTGSRSSKQRSSSLPPYESNTRMFNTHTSAFKNGNMKSERTIIDGSVMSKNTQISDSDFKQRSSSDSPTRSSSRRRLPAVVKPQDYNPIFRRLDSLDKKEFPAGRKAKSPVQSGNRFSSHSSEKTCGVAANESNNNNISSKLNKNTTTNSEHENDTPRKKLSSRSRRSVRAGQLSQRFPNQILVSSASLNSSAELGESLNSNSSSVKATSRSLPQPSIFKNHLPHERRKTSKLSRTN